MAVVIWYMEWPTPCFRCERYAEEWVERPDRDGGRREPPTSEMLGKVCWEVHGFTSNRSYVTAEFDRWSPELMLRVERGVAQR